MKLVERLEWGKYVTPFSDKDDPPYNWYSFKHRFGSELVSRMFSEFGLAKGNTVFDPFLGGSTMLISAKLDGYNAAGLDISPYSVFLSNVLTTSYKPARLEQVLNEIRHDVDPDIATPDVAILDKAFPVQTLKYIFSLKSGGFLRVTDHKRVLSRTVKKMFLETSKKKIKDISLYNFSNSSVNALLGDAGKYPAGLKNVKSDAILTSPPYPNRHDSTRIYELELLVGFINDNRSLESLRCNALRSHVEAKKRKKTDKTVIILLGPTGVGKTAASILLAKALDTEIISADSMLVYRHMDIGTAKPSREELAAVPHHLIDILEPDEKFSAGLFKQKAMHIINDLHGRDRIPLVVGGTGLYIRSLTGGLFEGPSADEQLRAGLKDEEKTMGRGHLYNKLKSMDPAAAARIEPNDLRRIVRALEVALTTEERISDVQRLETKSTGYDFIKVGLTRERKELYGIIEARVDEMMRDGLLEETRRLLKKQPSGTALQALGYKEMKLYIDGEIDLDEAVRMIKKRTKMYAKRQFTWFHKEENINWVDITGISDAGKIYTKILNDVKMLEKFVP